MQYLSTTSLPYHKLGHGSRILLAFHGIGQDGLSCYQPLADHLADHYTVYAFDLFYHGKLVTETKLEMVTKTRWSTLIQSFLDQHHIDRFDVAGFSMGGRFAMAVLEAFSERIDKAYLMAPDGISEHPLYSLASRFFPTRQLFGWLMRHPHALLRTAHTFKNIGVVNSSLYRFTEHVINTPQKRQTIYNAWVAFSPLRFDIPQLYQTIQLHQIDLYLFVGKYDKLLRVEQVRKLARLLPPNRYILLPSGHAQLVDKAAAYLRKSTSYTP